MGTSHIPSALLFFLDTRKVLITVRILAERWYYEYEDRPFLPAKVKEEVKEREEESKKAKNPKTVVAA